MKIGIVDADLISRKRHRFPNLACMKISAYWKERGAEVDLLLSYDEIAKYDKVFVSKVFTDTPVPEGIAELPNVECGGTGFFYDAAPPLPSEIEHTMPDYSLYDDFVRSLIEQGTSRNELKYYLDYSIGFTTRGCIRGCSFCVNKNYRACLKHSPVAEFLDPGRKYICLLDDNVFACKDWKKVFSELSETGKRFQFKQGLDERLLTHEKCEALFNAKWIGDYIFAFDNIKDRRIVERKLALMREHTQKIPKFYCFCAFNHDHPGTYPDGFWENDIADLFKRIEILFRHRALPYVMRYADYEISPYRGMYITIARWCNQASFAKKQSFREFASTADGPKSAAIRYMRDFEAANPDIAAKWFDMKWNDFN